MRLTDCHNIDDFRSLAKQRLPWPVFDYIDGAADDELTRQRNTAVIWFRPACSRSFARRISPPTKPRATR